MSKVTYNPIIESAHGKLHSQSDMWFMERHGTQFTGHRNNPRDYSLKPQSEAEKAGTLRMAAASKAYNQIIKGSPEWLALEQEYLANSRCPMPRRPSVVTSSLNT